MENDAIGISTNSADMEAAFENIFKTHFKNLHRYALTIIKDEVVAEEIVQNVFCKLWEMKKTLQVQSSAAYLYKAVYNESLNFLKHHKVKEAFRNQVSSQNNHQQSTTSDHVELKELNQKISVALNELPEQCRTIFQLSRFEELKYKEIAQRLGISVKTVENQMCKALRLLRSKLAAYLPMISLFIINLKK